MSAVQELMRGLAKFDVLAYGGEAHRVGRQELARDESIKDTISSLSALAADVSNTGSVEIDRPTYNLIEVSRLFLEAQDYIMAQEKPRYEPYAAALVLRHILGIDGSHDLAVTRRKIWSVFEQKVKEQIAFDSAAIAGTADQEKVGFCPQVARARCEILQTVRQIIPVRTELRVCPSRPVDRSLLDVAGESTGTSAVRSLLVFPQTSCHDEVSFLHAIHMSECLFWGSLLFVQRTLAALHSGQIALALPLVIMASEFAAPLVKLFHSVRKMPPEHFLGFRDATGEASAVQSLSWQLLDAHMYGVIPEKTEALSAAPELRRVLLLATPSFVPLVEMMQHLGGSAAEEAVHERVVELDHHLRGWRKFHEKQLAGRKDPGYLPPDAPGTGGTAGYGYLASQTLPPALRFDGCTQATPPKKASRSAATPH
ncbi:hypothetical protein [Streptomyces sp. NPDC006285]|uniref:hypothetical protein n=1 Tax=Streptomyces sp. NPDC006285 TaxID=3364742 RepID=UPI00368683B7